VAVAVGAGPLAHGTDIAGSIRFPAYACGIAGIRPSFGRVPSYNPTQLAERSLSSQLMSVQGPLARTVADLRLGLAAMAARDARDPWWVPAPLAGPAPPQPMRVAVVTSADDLAGSKLHPHISAAIANARAGLPTPVTKSSTSGHRASRA
jgi:amidase